MKKNIYKDINIYNISMLLFIQSLVVGSPANDILSEIKELMLTQELKNSIKNTIQNKID